MSAQLELLSPDLLEGAADCLKALAHPARLRMVEVLEQGEFPVHEIAEICGLPPHQTCEHLRLLKAHGLLSSCRRGRTVIYEIADPRLPRLMNCIRMSCQGR